MRVFALTGTVDLGKRVAALLDRSLDMLEEREFEDGEHKIRPLVSVRDQDVYVIHGLYADAGQSVNDKLCKLLFLLSTLRDCGARRVTAVVPYMCYARKDRRTKARDPVTMRYVATLFEAAGADRVVVLDVHNLQAFQNAFRCNTEHLEAQKVFTSYFQRELRDSGPVVVMSPDIGGIKRADSFRGHLADALQRDVGFAFMEKRRSKGVVSGETVVGEVRGSAVVILDDLINSGATMGRAAEACGQLGAKGVYAVATHGAFVGKANGVFGTDSVRKVVVTNTVIAGPAVTAAFKDKLVTLDVAPLLAESIRRMNTGGSLVSLMEME